MDTTTIPPASSTPAPAAPAAPTPVLAAGSRPPADRDGGPTHVALAVRGLRRTVRDRVLLDTIDLDIRAGTLVAIAGPSGSGKSTLLTAMAGLAPPSSGTVAHGGDLRVGFVPQQDIIHRDLPLDTTLTYAARLRLVAADPTSVERTVDETLDLLGLTAARHVRVGSLSGGQRKRASIAVELLTEPTICLLDEPTSGLDPISAAGVVACLRDLTARGVTAVMTTHDPSHLALADQVVFLASGGRLAFAGSPAEARAAFGVEALADVYDHLDGDPDGPPPQLPRSEPRPLRAPADGGRPVAGAASPPVGPPTRVPRASAAAMIRRWAVLTRRTAALLVANRLTMAVLIGSPVLVIAMMALLFPSGAFADPAAGATAGPQILFWTAFAGFFFGLTFGLLQIVTERDIARRERASGIGTTTYLAAKVGVLVPLLAVVCTALLAMLAVTDRLPTMDAATLARLDVTLVLEATAALALGMLASAAVGDAAQATLALPMLCFPQVLFAGAVVPLAAMSGVAQALSTPLATRWAFEALGRSLPAGPATSASAVAYPEVFTGSPVTGWVVLAASTVAALATTRQLLER